MTVSQQKEFISKIAPLVQKYAPQYGIKVCSPIIAQACLESAYGTSNKVFKPVTNQWRHNYFGLKWRNKRCAISNDYFVETTSEQNPDGSYKNIVSKFCKFKSLEDCVIGYFQWTDIPNYANLKGVTDPETYLKNIKEDKYATSLKYVEDNMNVIKKWNLTQYDYKSTIGGKGMRINVHAGHNPDGKVACGAVGIIKESTEARKVKDRVIKYLTDQGNTVYDCTVDDGKNKSNVLSKIVAKCNSHQVDLDVSIHFNAGAKDLLGNKKTTGTEVLIYNANASQVATRIANKISALGFTNRGVKIRRGLYVLRKTKATALLIECCFVDDKDDCNLYDVDKMAKAIAEGILNKTITTTSAPTKPSASSPNGSTQGCPFVVTCLDHLNIRETPGGKILYKGGCRKGTKYTIIKTSGNWGYLKSGKGWISILSKYVKRN